MRQYIKPNTESFSVITNTLMAASKELGVETPEGGFYYCSNSGCAAKYGLTWNSYSKDSRDLDSNKELLGRNNAWKTKVWQYIGCYEYKSNGSDVKCESFYGTQICEGTQWDLYINASGEYYVTSCPDGVH